VSFKKTTYYKTTILKNIQRETNKEKANAKNRDYQQNNNLRKVLSNNGISICSRFGVSEKNFL